MHETAVAPATDDRLARELRGFGPVGATVFVGIALLAPVLEPLPGLLVLAWARASRTPWRALGYVRPASWARTILVGVALGVALKLVMKAVVLPILGADPVNPAFHYLVGNTAALALIVLYIPLAAGFSEETVSRGFLFERLGALLGSSRLAKVAIVVLTSLWFAAPHYVAQGIPGVEQALLTGLVVGTIFAMRREIWTIMAAHTAFDLTAILIIYFDLETAVAHLVFR